MLSQTQNRKEVEEFIAERQSGLVSKIVECTSYYLNDMCAVTSYRFFIACQHYKRCVSDSICATFTGKVATVVTWVFSFHHDKEAA
jgi:hypothetical protein